MRLETGVIIRRTIGVVFVAIGIPALPMPIVSGALFIVVGLYLLSFDSSWLRAYLERWVARNHRTARMYKRIDDAIQNIFRIKKL